LTDRDLNVVLEPYLCGEGHKCQFHQRLQIAIRKSLRGNSHAALVGFVRVWAEVELFIDPKRADQSRSHHPVAALTATLSAYKGLVAMSPRHPCTKGLPVPSLASSQSLCARSQRLCSSRAVRSSPKHTAGKVRRKRSFRLLAEWPQARQGRSLRTPAASSAVDSIPARISPHGQIG
jgi:hypothetical protein